MTEKIAQGGSNPLSENMPVSAVCRSSEIVQPVRYEVQKGFSCGLDAQGDLCLIADAGADPKERGFLVRHTSGEWLSVTPYYGIETFAAMHRLPKPPAGRRRPDRPVESVPLKPRML